MKGRRRSRPRAQARAGTSEREALRRLDQVCRGVRLQTGPVALSDEYLALVAMCEAWPENRGGADKRWVARAQRGFADHYARARAIS